MEVKKTIFRNYDIRGLVPDEINDSTAYHIGRAVGTQLRKKNLSKVVIGRDDRSSSPELSGSISKGLVESGCNLIDVGITATPVIHFLTCVEDFDLGVIVTASHNPKNYNGFRFDYRRAKPFYGDQILMLRFLIEKELYEEGEGSIRREDLSQKYCEYLKKKFFFKKKHKVVIDCGSGASSELAPKIFEQPGVEVMPVYCDYNSNFPRGVPDPENKVFMGELRQKVLEYGADVGFAYDTDGDRFGAVDEKGNIYDTDELLIFFAEDILKRKPGAMVVYDVKSSALVEKVVTKLGGKPKLLRTGHPYFADIIQSKALLGAEFAGHVYFSDRYFGYDDGIYASLRVLDILDRKNLPFSELMKKYPKRFSTNELKVACPDELKFKVVNIVKIYIMNFVNYTKMTDIDGIRVMIGSTGWFLIRASNTSPYLSIRVEGRDENEKSGILKIVREALESVDIVKLETDF